MNKNMVVKKKIKEKYQGQWGVFTHDMYKATDEDYANAFLKAFDEYRDAFVFASECDSRAIHII